MITSAKRREMREEFLGNDEASSNGARKAELPPSERDFLVFEAIAFGGASTRQAAGEFDISQTRVVQIHRHVARWIATAVPDGMDLTPIQRLRLAAHIAQGRADFLYAQAMEAWRASQKPQTGECRGMRTGRDSHGDPRYLLVAVRISMRQFELAGTVRKVLEDAEHGSKFKGQGSKLAEEASLALRVGVVEVEEKASLARRVGAGERPLVRDCSGEAAESAADLRAAGDTVDASDCQTEVCNEIENRRRAFLAALEDDTAPVHPPFTDAGGMLLDSLEPAGGHSATASVRESEDEPAIVPLSRKELRKQRRIQARQQRKAK